ncbi:hypothetical protein [Paraburkholderia humisilvae]|uniref:hypothetical protein n=1 Tax=Paraburkholderia humisilvae TaxID=627669 RepID=UPI001FE7444E|nr:hypothetical protein [Paraburkholderia humisilvae]
MNEQIMLLQDSHPGFHDGHDLSGQHHRKVNGGGEMHVIFTPGGKTMGQISLISQEFRGHMVYTSTGTAGAALDQ